MTKTTYPRPGILLPAGLLLCASFTIARGETITQTVGNIDWNAAMWGTPAAAPTAGNSYVSDAGLTVFRISASGAASTFGGDSLTVVAGSRALMKNTSGAVSTINGNFTLDGGRLSYAPNGGPFAATLRMTNFVVSGTGSFIDASSSATALTIDGILTGSSDLLVKAENGTNTKTISFTGVSNFTGALTVQATIRLDFGAAYTFTNTLNLQTTATLNVDQALTFEAGDLVANGVIIPAGTYTGAAITGLGANFVDGGGSLTVTATDTDSDGLPDFYENQIINFDGFDEVEGYEDVAGPGNAPATTDFDSDGRSDTAEYASGVTASQTNPTNPDTDGDGLRDGPEVAGTNNLGVSTGFGPTNPNNKNSDGDSFDDSTEVRYGFDPNNGSVQPGTAVTVVNGSFEDPVVAPTTEAVSVSSGTVTGWTVGENDYYVTDAFTAADPSNPTSPANGLQFATADRRAPAVDVDPSAFSDGIDSTMSLKQDIDVTSLAAEIDAGTRTFLLDFNWLDNDAADEGVVTLEFLDGSGTNLGRRSVFRTTNSGQVWKQTRHAGHPPVGTRTVRVTAAARKNLAGATSVRNIAYDNFTARLVHFDLDNDDLPDDWELVYGLDPDDSGDAALTADSDELTNLQEFERGTNPTLVDTDGDGISDDLEVTNGTDPLDPGDPVVDLRVTSIVTTKDGAGEVTKVEVVVSGLVSGKTYNLVRGTDLTTFPIIVESRVAAGSTETFTDLTPIPGSTSSKAFYRLAD